MIVPRELIRIYKCDVRKSLGRLNDTEEHLMLMALMGIVYSVHVTFGGSTLVSPN